MQESAAASALATAGSFASVLAAFSAPAAAPKMDWAEEDLGEDIATLSYEQALRTHARNRTSPQGDLPGMPKNAAGQDALNKSAPDSPLPTATRATPPRPERSTRSAGPSGAEYSRATSLEESRKAASITIRLSIAESAKLHERAAEAGLTVSAYLRSCAFEVEALRAQVKEALAQLRPAGEGERQEPVKTRPHPAPKLRARLFELFPRWVRRSQTAPA